METERKIQWHPAFFGTLHTETLNEKENFQIGEEFILNTMPLKIDVIITKKDKTYTSLNQIGKIFRTYNLMEFKSPKDRLDYNVFLKGIAYAYLFKVLDKQNEKIELSDMSLTFIRASKPIGLLKRLKKEKFTIEETYPGIYYINRYNEIPIQIVVTKELEVDKHIWLCAISGPLDEIFIKKLLKKTNKLTDPNDKYYADSVWEIVTRQNLDLILKMKEDEEMCKAMAELFKPEIEAAFDNGFNNGINQGASSKGIQVYKNLIASGFSKEDAQSLTEISDELVKQALA